MLQVDLARLRRQHRLEVSEDVPADSALFGDAEVRLAGPLHVELEAQDAGGDVVVRGRIEGLVALECRRCLKPVRAPLDEAVSALYTAHLDEVDPADEVYALPQSGAALELGGLVREALILAAPRFAVCDEACRGLCPRCGADLNEGPCGCVEESVDPRWGPLRNLELD